MKHIHLALASLTLPLLAISVRAGNPIGGLITAISSDGTKLVAGGDTRTILVLDPETLAVTHREWTGRSITNLAFSRDGATLVAQDTSDEIVLYDTATWSTKVQLPKRAAFSTSPGADLFVGHDANYSGPTVHGHVLADGSETFSIPLPKGTKIAALALSPDGLKLALLTEGEKDASEPEVPYAETPKELKGPELDDFKQKNDGRTSTLLFFATSTKEKLSETKLHYTSSTGTKLHFDGDDLIVLNYTNLNARINPAGEVSLFKLEHGLNYGVDLSLDGKVILGGGMNSYSLTEVAGLTAVKGTTDKLPSWPEYWKGFSSVATGQAVYGGTTAYRVFKLNSGGAILKSEPVR